MARRLCNCINWTIRNYPTEHSPDRLAIMRVPGKQAANTRTGAERLLEAPSSRSISLARVKTIYRANCLYSFAEHYPMCM